jgi:hypothetical protein
MEDCANLAYQPRKTQVSELFAVKSADVLNQNCNQPTWEPA